MQYIAHVRISGEVVKVLVRRTSCGVSLKMRRTGKNGNELTDESEYLKDDPNAVKRLKDNETIQI